MPAHDYETRQEYVERSAPVLVRHDAGCSCPPSSTLLRCPCRRVAASFERLVVGKLESIDRVAEFHHSDDYEAIIALRHASADSHVYHPVGVLSSV